MTPTREGATTPTLDEIRAAVIERQATEAAHADWSERDFGDDAPLGEYHAWKARLLELSAAKDLARRRLNRMLNRFVWDENGKPTPEYLAAITPLSPPPTP